MSNAGIPLEHPTTTNEGSKAGKWSDSQMSGEGGNPSRVSMLFNIEDDILVLHKEFRVILLYYRSQGAVCRGRIDFLGLATE